MIGCVYLTSDGIHLRNTCNVLHQRQHLYCLVASYFMCVFPVGIIIIVQIHLIRLYMKLHILVHPITVERIE